ncbi:hypothetical protein JTE90_021054 [Oedothorax gibbosus]|uniref:Uncharacterized protein n=1 Tax=Oedothorax gibbosus TaxID=931172 RepID=A0AAV6VSK5_9ARAC|nr:hypothetical protein JTE90_021054 [Oedothorax gibbosus]
MAYVTKMTSHSLPQRYRHSHSMQYLHPNYNPQVRYRRNNTWEMMYRGCGSMWASDASLTLASQRFYTKKIRNQHHHPKPNGRNSKNFPPFKKAHLRTSPHLATSLRGIFKAA